MLKNIFIVSRAGSGCDYHRILLPFKYMPEIELVNRYDRADLVIFNRLPIEPVDLFLQNQKRFGFKYLVDLDDFWLLYHHHYLYQAWANAGITEQIQKIIKNADAITVTNARLLDMVRDIAPHKKIYIVPNALPFDDHNSQFTTNTKPGETPTFIFAGGKSHFHDLQLLRQPFSYLQREYNWKFILGGVDINDPLWQKICRTFAGLPNYEHRAHAPIDRYMSIYNQASVALAPLEYNDFNVCKSNLKILEAGCKNLMCITSDMHPYRNDLDADFITRCKSSLQWYDAIHYAITNPNYIKDRGMQLGEHVRRHYQLEDANKIRREIYATLLQ